MDEIPNKLENRPTNNEQTITLYRNPNFLHEALSEMSTVSDGEEVDCVPSYPHQVPSELSTVSDPETAEAAYSSPSYPHQALSELSTVSEDEDLRFVRSKSTTTFQLAMEITTGFRQSPRPTKDQEVTLAEMGHTLSQDLVVISRSTRPLSQLIQYIYEQNVKPNVLVKVGATKFSCNLIVLQAYAKYFHTFSTGALVVLPQKKVTAGAFFAIYKWMLSDTKERFPPQFFMEIFSAVVFLGVTRLEEQCWVYVDNDGVFVEDTAVLLFLEACQWEVKELKLLMLDRISKFFLTLVASEEYLALEPDDVCSLLGSGLLAVNREIEVFMAAVRWLEHNWDERKRHLTKIMNSVRFKLMPLYILLSLKSENHSETVRRVVCHNEVSHFINDALTFAAENLWQSNYGTTFQKPIGHNLSEPVPRCWVYDEKCAYHHLSYCPTVKHERLTYDLFLSYLEMLQTMGGEHWKSLYLADDHTHGKPCCMKAWSRLNEQREDTCIADEPTYPGSSFVSLTKMPGKNQMEAPCSSRQVNANQSTSSIQESPQEDTQTVLEPLSYQPSSSRKVTIKLKTVSNKSSTNTLKDSETQTCNFAVEQKISDGVNDGTKRFEDVHDWRKCIQYSDRLSGGNEADTPSETDFGIALENAVGAAVTVALEAVAKQRKGDATNNVIGKQNTPKGSLNVTRRVDAGDNIGDVRTLVPSTTLAEFNSITKQKIFLICGCDNPDTYGGSTLFYDQSVSQWKKLCSIPFHSPCHYAAITCKKKIYVVGGIRDVPISSTEFTFLEKCVWIFDPHTLIWSLECTIPEPRRNFAVITMDEIFRGVEDVIPINGFFLIGGESENGQILETVWFYDIDQKSWTIKDPLNIGRCGCAACVINRKICVAGGMVDCRKADGSRGDRTSRTITNTVEFLNQRYGEGPEGKFVPEDGVWVLSKKTLRLPRFNAQLCKISDEAVYLIGGAAFSNAGVFTMTDVDTYDFKEGQWVYYGDIKVARQSPQLLVQEKCIFVIGGFITRYGQPQNLIEVEVFDTEIRGSLKMPSLPMPQRALAALLVD